MDAKVTGSSSSFKIRRGSSESTQKGGMCRFGVAATFACREPCLDTFRVVVGLREDNRRVSSRPALATLGMHHTLWEANLGPIRVRSEKPTRIESLDFEDELGTSPGSLSGMHFPEEDISRPNLLYICKGRVLRLRVRFCPVVMVGNHRKFPPLSRTHRSFVSGGIRINSRGLKVDWNLSVKDKTHLNYN
ncbi:hypothetical protein PIB30_083856 [Stylosanthes scabra]|uniref:Uncharacterized protein n=1 Tax=Stylosanthes scabra TaxID=79078 RepID=A0ABU6TUJ5_9FABA|nr:hypothetical protein [Stylosanthes scabra]